MTYKLEAVTSDVRVGFDENANQYVIYKVGDNFPYCYSRIASFGREVDALEWYKRVNSHETLVALVEELSTALGSVTEPSDKVFMNLINKATETLNKIKGE